MKELEEKKYRFYYHYYRQYNSMSVHFKGQCMRVKNVEVRNLSTETKWYDTQPNLRVQGWCTNVILENDKAIIS